MKIILTVIGARPQFIKASVVSHAIAKQPDLQEILLHTGQHYDPNMSVMCSLPNWAWRPQTIT